MAVLQILCSCIPGFEKVAIGECFKKLGVVARMDVRGRIIFSLCSDELLKLTILRSVQHHLIIVSEIRDCWAEDINGNACKIMEILCKYTDQAPWDDALKGWAKFKSYRRRGLTENAVAARKYDEHDCNIETGTELSTTGSVCSSDVVLNSNISDPLSAGSKLSFRSTCYRTGEHPFGSMDIAKELGSIVNNKFLWRVDLTNFDIEVVFYLMDKTLRIAVQLTHESQSLRNITHFGPTTLKANISYCLLCLAELRPGDIVLDPMCGGGSISLEASSGFPETFQFLGDNHLEAVSNSAANFSKLEKSKITESGVWAALPFALATWDVYRLPLRTESIDAIVTDLPFGKKMGTKKRNLFLYPIALSEMGRVCKPSGRAVLLTLHKQAMKRALLRCHATGNSAYNAVERFMTPWSRDLSRRVLPHDYFGSHLNRLGRATGLELS